MGSNATVFRIIFSSFKSGRDLHFHEHFRLEISSKCDIKAENSSTLCKFHEGREGLRPMGSNVDLPKISGLSRRARLDSSYNISLIVDRLINEKYCPIV